MAKAVLISIRPEWVEKIVRNEKTVEVRKTRPKLDTPFKCYIYCTQGNDARRLRGSWGKVIGEFICDRVETIKAASITIKCFANAKYTGLPIVKRRTGRDDGWLVGHSIGQ